MGNNSVIPLCGLLRFLSVQVVLFFERILVGKGEGREKNRGFANLIIKILLKAMFFTYLPTALAAGIVQSFHISSPLSVAFAQTMRSI